MTPFFRKQRENKTCAGSKYVYHTEGHFPLGGIFRAERYFLLFKDQLAESGRQKTKENIIPHGKFRLVEKGPNTNTLTKS